MIGPTGVGKTEIARRIANIIHAPFIKIEATKFTEVGYVGRDVDSIIRDLLTVAIESHREEALAEAKDQAESNVESIIIEALMKADRPKEEASTAPSTDKPAEASDSNPAPQDEPVSEKPTAIQKDETWYRTEYRKGTLDDHTITIETKSSIGVEIMTPVGMEDISSQLNNWLQTIPSEKGKATPMKVAEAKKSLLQEESHALINEEQIKSRAIESVEQNGIVFLDEIDKVIKNTTTNSDVSREGVQRDLLPLIEGTTVQTKYGAVNTDHILFIASGAFMGVQPSDMASELQGRLPIRVNLNPLTEQDFSHILSRTKSALTQQYTALLATEGVDLQFTDGGIQTLAAIAFKLNARSDNIGARRLYAVMEKCLESISFDAHHHKDQKVLVDEAYVKKHLPVSFDDANDLAKWIL